MNSSFHIVQALVLTAAVLLSARLWGEAILRWMRWTGEGGGERHLLSLALGLGSISYAIFALACLGLLYPFSIWILLALSLPAALSGGIFRRPAAALPAGDRKTVPLPRSAVLALSVVALLFAFNLFSAFVPPSARDALGYHLPAPRAYLAAHRLIWLPGNVLTNQPSAVDMLFSVGFAGKSEFFPQILHCVFGLLTAAAIYIFGRRWFGPSSAALGSLIFYSLPTVSAISGWAYIDLGLSLWTVLAVFSYLRWREEALAMNENSRRFAKIRGFPFGLSSDLVLAAIFSGLAMGSKYTGLIVSGLLWSLAALEAIRWGRGAGNAVLGAAILALALASPWYVKNLILSGNPVYPFAYSLFDGRDWDAVRARDYRQILLGYGMGNRPIDYLLLPWNLSVRADYTYGRFDGILGPAFLLFIPLAFFTGRKTPTFRFLSWYCLLFFVIWSLLSQQVRMLLPILPFAALLSGEVVARLWERRSRAVRAALALGLGAVMAFDAAAIGREAIHAAPWRLILGRETREEYLSRLIYNYPAVAFINCALPPASRILFVYGGNAWYYARPETVVESIFQDATFLRLVRQSVSGEDLAAHLKAAGITHLLVNRDLVNQGLADITPKQAKLLDDFWRRIKTLYRTGSNYVYEI